MRELLRLVEQSVWANLQAAAASLLARTRR
jgi:hypothetical protein